MDDETNQDPAAQPTGKTFTEEEVNRLLTRERDKLHGRLNKADETSAAVQAELAELREAEKTRKAAEAKAAREAEAARKKAEEAELSAKELIERRSRELQEQYQKQQDEWASQVSTLQQQMQDREAVYAKERAFHELTSYAQQAIAANQDKIVPELRDLVTGNTPEEIDASIAQMIAKTDAIFGNVQRAQQQQRAQMPGVSTGGFAPNGPLEGAGQGQGFTREQIDAMSGPEYARNRAAIMAQHGLSNGGNGVGLYG